jgi:acyl dehydratase
MAIVVSRPSDLTSRVKEHLGWSDWHVVTQVEIDHFAEATGNRAPIHVDPEYAKTTPYGATIAYGIQILAMATMLLSELWELRVSGGVDVGANKVRHLGPVRAGTGVRVGARILDATDVGGAEGAAGVRTTIELTFEAQGADRPVCVAEIVFIYSF